MWHHGLKIFHGYIHVRVTHIDNGLSKSLAKGVMLQIEETR